MNYLLKRLFHEWCSFVLGAILSFFCFSVITPHIHFALSIRQRNGETFFQNQFFHVYIQTFISLSNYEVKYLFIHSSIIDRV